MNDKYFFSFSFLYYDDYIRDTLHGNIKFFRTFDEQNKKQKIKNKTYTDGLKIILLLNIKLKKKV